MDGTNWVIIITGVTALGGGTWLGHFMHRHKTAAETEGKSVSNVSMTNIEWKKLYDEMSAQVALLRLEVADVKDELREERRIRRELQDQVRQNKHDLE